MNSWYLKDDVILEPLVCNWFAWPFLISPLTAAAYLTKKYLPMLESYIQEPLLHDEAFKNKTIRAASFIRNDSSLEFMKQHFAELKMKLKRMVELSESIDEVNRVMLDRRGMSLASIYELLPASLKGKIELVYDLNHSPSIRFVECFFYRSAYFDPKLQSIRLRQCSTQNSDFAINSPMFNNLGVVVDVQFDSYFVDLLGRSRWAPINLEELCDLVPMSVENKQKIRELFTETRPRTLDNATEDDTALRIKYFGHACLSVEYPNFTILTDPVMSAPMGGDHRPRYSYSDLPAHIDLVLITHNHQDHVVIDCLIQLRERIGTIVVPKSGGGFLQDPSLKLLFESLGFKKIVEIGEMETLHFGDLKITGVPFLGEHGEINIQSKVGFHITDDRKSILVLADSDVVDLDIYKSVHNICGDVDIVFIGLDSIGAPFRWLYSSLYSSKLDYKIGSDRRINGSNSQKALQIVDIFHPIAAFPYAMGLEPWISHITGSDTSNDNQATIEVGDFLRGCYARGIHSRELYWMDLITVPSVGNAISNL
ncbi:MBL fold metallo-hydrolase [Pseudomonas graminis]|uniref:MBL fold metallo-hydrolase n=1 Tax=Pseudomonas graminis TaxID=158627 RepID=UPI00234983DB|nr:MBL fold metallo-hydrolase [Pseudomonas graminis]MDC6379898.1 MBL fold metallo-hydrolase [Pseudomonas graminis]